MRLSFPLFARNTVKNIYQRDHSSLNLRNMSKLNKRSEVLTAMIIKITVFWDLAACSSVTIHQTARRHIAEDHNLDTKYFLWSGPKHCDNETTMFR
jgi:hypothetical protein